MMYNLFSKHVLLSVILFCYAGSLYSQQLAFPSAEGWGKYSLGGRGGKVIEVTNLNDNGSGSLRAAVDASGARTVVFRVSGTIQLESNLEIQNPYITIAGQTAPGDGICLKKYPLVIETDHVIIRYIRVRLGNESGEDSDAISSRYNSNIIIDHVSASWSIDECVSIYHNENVTVQWSLISESLYNADHVKGHHGFGGIWGGPKASYHHNLFAHHSSRNPRFASGCGDTDYRNNVLYNWGYQSSYGAEKVQNSGFTGSFINMVANYYKSGPGTLGGNNEYKITRPSSRNYLEDYGDWYVEDNYVFGYPNITNDNWSGGVQPDDNTELVKESIRSIVPAPHDTINQQIAQLAYQLVMDNVGASLPKRDTIDKRIVHEVLSGTATYGTGSYNSDNGLGAKPSGIIDSQADVGGWPILQTRDVPVDTDHDGMPDDWEDANGLDKNDPDDRNDIGANGYTNLEIYLNSLTEVQQFLFYPVNVSLELIGVNKTQLNWKDYNEDIEGLKIERATGDTGSFTVIAQLTANVEHFVDSMLLDSTTYRYRILAYSDSLSSGFEKEVSVMTISMGTLPLEVSDPAPIRYSKNISTDTSLSWKASINADSYDIYFGLDNPPPFITNQQETRYVVSNLEEGEKYYWRINAKNPNGVTEGALWNFTVKKPDAVLKGLQDEDEALKIFPNPVIFSTSIRYKVKVCSEVDLRIYNSMAQEVKLLVNEPQPPGEYTVEFNASVFEEGIYFCKIKIGLLEQREKILLMK